MRKHITVVFALLLALLFCGCSQAQPFDSAESSAAEPPTNDIVLKNPPDLFVIYSAESFVTLRGTASWSYSNGDGTWGGFEDDCQHPLECKEYMTPITLSAGATLDAYLRWEVAPDKVTVRCWRNKCWNDIDAKSTDVPVDIVGADLEDAQLAGLHTVTLKSGGYVYEVYAKWNSSQNYNGNARYVFYTVKP